MRGRVCENRSILEDQYCIRRGLKKSNTRWVFFLMEPVACENHEKIEWRFEDLQIRRNIHALQWKRCYCCRAEKMVV